MADFWTHLVAGERMAKGIAVHNWQEMLCNNKKIFNFGCQGPDFFFYHDFWPWQKEKRGPAAGVKLQQERVRELFLEFVDYVKDLKEQEESSFKLAATYLTGFLAHYVIDKNIHPFINERAEPPYEHKKLEVLIGCYFVEKYWHQEAFLLRPAERIDPGNDLPPVLNNLYRYLLNQVHHYPDDQINFINEAYHDMIKILNLFYCPAPLKRMSLLLLNTVLPVDLSMLIYPRHPDYSRLGKEEWRQVEDILARGIDEGLLLLALIIDYLNDKLDREALKENLPRVNFDGEPIA